MLCFRTDVCSVSRGSMTCAFVNVKRPRSIVRGEYVRKFGPLGPLFPPRIVVTCSFAVAGVSHDDGPSHCSGCLVGRAGLWPVIRLVGAETRRGQLALQGHGGSCRWTDWLQPTRPVVSLTLLRNDTVVAVEAHRPRRDLSGSRPEARAWVPVEVPGR